MLFNSIQFILFFSLVFILYWVTPNKRRWIILLLASYLFYMSWEPAYALIILLSTSIDYFACRYLTGSDSKTKRKTGLITSVTFNLGLLFVFKYYDFFQDSMQDLLGLFDVKYAPEYSSLLLPVGISFYTFQTLSYSIDVYRKKINIEKHFGKFALFVSYFPQLVAGPIERAGDLLPRFSSKKQLNYDDLSDGSRLFIWGLFKKVVVADNLKVLVDHVFEHPEFQSGGGILFTLFAFTIQIYADFSGYSDMAIGLSRTLGIKLSTNFRTPYFSQSFTEFWGRWHITFSTWLKDYFFKPLGGMSRTSSKVISYFLLFLTFTIAGIWHGASWNFVVWGMIGGIMVVIERITGWRKTVKHRFWRIPKIVFNFSLLVLTAIFFRSIDGQQCLDLIYGLTTIRSDDLYLAFTENLFTPGMIGIGILFITDLFFAQKSILDIKRYPFVLRSIWLLVICVLILFLGDSNSQEFIYFKF